MITAAIVTGFLAGLTALLSLLPAVQLPATAADASVHFVATLNKAIPIEQVFLAALAVCVVRLGIYGWNLVLFVYHQFWGSS